MGSMKWSSRCSFSVYALFVAKASFSGLTTKKDSLVFLESSNSS